MSDIGTTVIDEARKARENEPEWADRGFVIISPQRMGFQVAGWSSELTSPKSWVPGCFAVDCFRNIWIGVGGNDSSGSQRWEPFRERDSNEAVRDAHATRWAQTTETLDVMVSLELSVEEFRQLLVMGIGGPITDRDLHEIWCVASRRILPPDPGSFCGIGADLNHIVKSAIAAAKGGEA